MATTTPDPFTTARYIAWVDHGVEGWHPHLLDSVTDLAKFLLEGRSYGNRVVLTQPVELLMRESPRPRLEIT